jgi:lysophospholipase L1-like esterase
MKKIIYSIIIFFFVFCCIELFCRVFRIGTDFIDERNLVYKYDNKLGWIGKPNINTYYKGVSVVNNSLGFRDIEHNYKEKNKKRIMFIGDSFCFGYGVNQDKVFVELLRDKLKEYELFNCGISGYGTDQEYLLLMQYFDVVKPDIVFLLYSDNDIIDNVLNNNYLGYYKPYFVPNNNDDYGLILKGVPVPKSWLYYRNNFFIKYISFNKFILKNYICLKNPCLSTHDYKILKIILFNMQNFLKSKNCELILCIASDSDSNFRTILKNNNAFFIDLENSNIIENDMHWNEKGHEYVADKIYNFLKKIKIK